MEAQFIQGLAYLEFSVPQFKGEFDTVSVRRVAHQCIRDGALV